jgi:tetratricopeptide (TPR) repeat protein
MAFNPSLLSNDSKTKTWFAAFFLLFLCVITYGDTLSHQFMIDDHAFLQGKIAYFYHGLGDFFTKPYDQHYSPIHYLLNGTLFQLFHKPLPFYLINLGLFYINCVLLFFFVYLVSKNYAAALLTTIVFCVHPMTGDVLQHITFNILFLQTIFIESAMILLYLYAKENRPIFYYILSVVMVFLALLCHELTFLFPFYAMSLLFFLTDLKFKKIIKILLPFIFLDLLSIILWLSTVNSQVHVEKLNILSPEFLWNTCANFSHLCFWYLSNLFYPQNIVFMCNMPPLGNSICLWNLGLLAFLIGCFISVVFYFKRSLESFALVLFLMGFIYPFFASLIRFEHEGQWEFAPHWVYFFSVGFYLWIVLILLKLRARLKKSLYVCLWGALVASCFLSTWTINRVSRTEISYCENWIRKFPDNTIAMNLVANFYRNNINYNMPLDLVSDMFNMVDMYLKYNHPKEALELIKNLSSSKISLAQKEEISYKLAAYHCKNGLNPQCEELINRIMGANKGPDLYMQLSYAFYKSGADQAAINLLKQCKESYPEFKESYLLLGVILANKGLYKESIDFWKQGLTIDPTDQRFVLNINNAKRLAIGEKL